MKKLLIISIVGLLSISCTSNDSKWEYKTVSVKGVEQEERGVYQANSFKISDESLNLFGKDGWELVGIYDKIETVHPNYGSAEYVTGLQPNVRTCDVNFIFKRKK